MAPMLWFIMLLTLIIGMIPLLDRWYRRRAEQQDFTVYTRIIRDLRLSKMLEYFGIDLTDYLRRMPRTEINRHILQCSSCRNLDVCDTCLGERRCPVDMHFCPNYSSLTRHSHLFTEK